MKLLSQRQAQECEDATTDRCTCRCGGALHGAKRGPVNKLSEGDLHRPPSPKNPQLLLLPARVAGRGDDRRPDTSE